MERLYNDKKKCLLFPVLKGISFESQIILVTSVTDEDEFARGVVVELLSSLASKDAGFVFKFSLNVKAFVLTLFKENKSKPKEVVKLVFFLPSALPLHCPCCSPCHL